jgi:hypothetical protein
MTDYDIDPYIWFGNRQLDFHPKHFVLSDTPLTLESKQWVLDNIKGRFCIIHSLQLFLLDYNLGNIAFENPKDAMFYELKWS